MYKRLLPSTQPRITLATMSAVCWSIRSSLAARQRFPTAPARCCSSPAPTPAAAQPLDADSGSCCWGSSRTAQPSPLHVIPTTASPKRYKRSQRVPSRRRFLFFILRFPHPFRHRSTRCSRSRTRGRYRFRPIRGSRSTTAARRPSSRRATNHPFVSNSHRLRRTDIFAYIERFYDPAWRDSTLSDIGLVAFEQGGGSNLTHCPSNPAGAEVRRSCPRHPSHNALWPGQTRKHRTHSERRPSPNRRLSVCGKCVLHRSYATIGGLPLPGRMRVTRARWAMSSPTIRR